MFFVSCLLRPFNFPFHRAKGGVDDHRVLCFFFPTQFQCAEVQKVPCATCTTFLAHITLGRPLRRGYRNPPTSLLASNLASEFGRLALSAPVSRSFPDHSPSLAHPPARKYVRMDGANFRKPVNKCVLVCYTWRQLHRW